MGSDLGTENHAKPSNAKFRVEYLPARGHFVVSPHGERVSIFYRGEDQAQAECDAKQRQADAKAKRGARPCLCCGATFTSQGIHNRMCNPCRHRASNDEASPFSFGAIHGRKRA